MAANILVILDSGNFFKNVTLVAADVLFISSVGEPNSWSLAGRGRLAGAFSAGNETWNDLNINHRTGGKIMITFPGPGNKR